MKETNYSKQFRVYEDIVSNTMNPHTKAAQNMIADLINVNEKRKDELEEIRIKKQSITRDNAEMITSYGNFYFNYYSEPLSLVSPQTLLRFLYLCCYMDYDNFLKVDKDFVNTEKLKKLLNLSYAEFYKTRNSLLKYNLITINEAGFIEINKKYCVKGKSKTHAEKIRVFEEALKELYAKAKPREHSQLCLLYLLLPYVNFRLNICCAATTESDAFKIEPYTLKDLAVILHQTNLTRFKRRLQDMTVAGEPVICIAEINRKQVVAINPRVYYKGSYGDIEKMEGIGLLFDAAIGDNSNYNFETYYETH